MDERHQGRGRSGEGIVRSCLSQDLSDPYHATYLSFYLLGLGSLLPWYFFSTAKGYWDYKFSGGNSSSEQSSNSDLLVYFESYLSIASTVPNVFVSVLNVLLIHKLSANVRVLSSLATMLLIFAVTAALVKVDTSTWLSGFFGVTMTCVVVVNSATAVFLGSLYGLAALFPAKYPQAFITGQAMGGTLSVLASIVDIAAAGDVTDSALAYFLTADIYVLVCIVIYLRLCKLPFARYHISYEAPPSINYDARDAASVQSDSDEPYPADTDVLMAPAYTHAPRQQEQHQQQRSFPPVRAILRETRWLCLCVFFCFYVSMILFPPVLANIVPTSVSPESVWAKKYFVPVAIFLVYNLGDLVGRVTAGWLRWPAPESWLMPALVFLRTAFLPLFAFCNYQPRRHTSTLLLANDAVPVVLTALLGVTNGHLGSTALTFAPRVVPAEMAEATGAVMTFFLSLGLAAGALSSNIFMRFI
uniref:Equilibrative nucleoside transporter 3 n=2 Tax=Petromyzon marinus TaxID=7757 RepID=A0AAJ7TVS4_PETMA|nr:equilibrative nucleoside transporter 3 [Petromyzon marinus]XP_032824992.1 equilibrative nucleoside transporter 3 [Petromyzon marinus]XP_032824993.1 equilibrative nucleoside transporter 3 [Petromyzon marinus]XP_032824994.1 equilibrative nucleoside transporter 3 [Petromyzon marinus]